MLSLLNRERGFVGIEVTVEFITMETMFCE